jgi:hypothetical protein
MTVTHPDQTALLANHASMSDHANLIILFDIFSTRRLPLLTSASMYFGEQLSQSHSSVLLRGRALPDTVAGGRTPLSDGVDERSSARELAIVFGMAREFHPNPETKATDNYL